MKFTKHYKKGFSALLLFILLLSLATSSLAAADSNTQNLQTGIDSGNLPTSPQANTLNTSSISEEQQVNLVLAHLRKNAQALGLTQADLADYVVTDHYTNKKTGLTYIYLRQRHQGIDVYNAIINVTLNQDGKVINIGNRFIPNLQKKVTTNPARFNALRAVEQVTDHLGINRKSALIIKGTAPGLAQKTIVDGQGLSLEDIPVQLVYQPTTKGEVRLAWEVGIYTLDAENYWFTRIDAESGQILDTNNLVIHDNWGPAPTGKTTNNSIAPTVGDVALLGPIGAIPNAQLSPNTYVVYPSPMESPTHLLPPNADDPPLSQDNRVAITDMATSASPYGWHDINGAAGAEYTITRGNNVHAYQDATSPSNGSAGDEPNGGADLIFDQPLDLTQSPSTYHPAAVVNLFYWNNIIHDVWYNYGFDEASGNFQENNYGNGGSGSDYVYAEAQDSSGTCNANFSTPTDGSNPRMQMYVCNNANPGRDGDFDNAVIVHEYGHGISIRLTSGPGTSSCLNNAEQGGEGWSDWFGMMMTIESNPDGTLADAGTDARGMGTYLFGEASTGPGIRNAPYSTDMGVNNYTYGNIGDGNVSQPHGVGFIWATMLWEMNWNLIDVYGFDADIYNGTSGNNMAMELVIEGLKLQPCSPGFVDARDAILQADQNLNGGSNQCLIWNAFAKRGLGYSADQGSTSSRTDGTEAFDLPPICLQTLKLIKTANPNPATSGGVIEYTLTAVNDTPGTLTNVTVTDDIPANTTYVAGSASNGGNESGGTVTFPGVTLNSGQSIAHTFQVLVDGGYGSTLFFNDDMESGSGNWTATHGSGSYDWNLGTASPYSGAYAWFAQDVGSISDQYLAMSNGVTLSSNATLRVWHSYATESGYDGGVIEISTNGGSTWSDVGGLATQNGYNGTLSGSYNNPIGGRSAFSGSSGGYVETLIDLSSYAGQTVQIRFRIGTDSSVSSTGWYVDDVEILDEAAINNTACATAAEGDSACDTITTQVINTGGNPTPTPAPTNTPAPTPTPGPTNTPTPTPLPTNTPPPAPTATNTPAPSYLHVGDLDGSSVSNRNRWDATVVITVHDGSENGVANVTVTGNWNNGSGSVSCVTNSAGQCSLTETRIRSNISSVTFTVDNVTQAGYVYLSTANHDPDGDSNGSAITILQP